MTTAGIRFIVDENLVGLARAVTMLRRDVATVGSPVIDEVLPTEILDPDRIPLVAARGWIMITDDEHLRTRPVEAELAVHHGLKVVHLYGAGHRNAWDQAVQLLAGWRAIERHLISTRTDRGGCRFARMAFAFSATPRE